MTSNDYWMTSDDPREALKNLHQMVTTGLPIKFQVQMNLFTNMASHDPRITSDDIK